MMSRLLKGVVIVAALSTLAACASFGEGETRLCVRRS